MKPTVGELHPAYVAGILDGEGSISVYRTTTPSGHEKFQLQVCVVMREESIIRELANQYGGNVRRDDRNARINPDHSVVWRWRIGDKKAAAFLSKVKEYLLAKRVQAELAIHFTEYKPAGGKRTSQQLLVQQDVWREMRRQNMRGVGKW